MTCVFIEKRNKKGGFKNPNEFEKFPQGTLLTHSVFLRKARCHRLRIYGEKGNGLGKRWCELFWEGVSFYCLNMISQHHDAFTNDANKLCYSMIVLS